MRKLIFSRWEQNVSSEKENKPWKQKKKKVETRENNHSVSNERDSVYYWSGYVKKQMKTEKTFSQDSPYACVSLSYALLTLTNYRGSTERLEGRT